MSASDKPRLAGRQPSTRGGVPRVKTWLSSTRVSASAGPTGSGTDCDDRDPRGISATKGHHLDE